MFRVVMIISQAFPIVSEVLLVFATWRHANAAELADRVHIKVSVTAVLLRDGGWNIMC